MWFYLGKTQCGKQGQANCQRDLVKNTFHISVDSESSFFGLAVISCAYRV
jgi:hypothetical protein